MRVAVTRSAGLALLVATVAGGTAAGQELQLEPVWRRGQLLAGWYGRPRIEVTDLDGDGAPEILTCGAYSAMGLSPDGTGAYWDSWHSPELRCRATTSADRDGDGRREVWVVSGSDSSGWRAELFLFDPAQPAPLARLPLTGYAHSSSPPVDLAVADVDSDGELEVVLVGRDTDVLDARSLQLEWHAPEKGGDEVAVGDLDGDGSLEIVVNSAEVARVLDGAAQAEELTRPGGLGLSVDLADVDGDGRSEIAFIDGGTVGVLDGVTFEPIWTVELDQGTFDALGAADVDRDGRPDVVATSSGWGSVHAYNGASGAALGSIANPEYESKAVTAGDVDADGAVEAVWAAEGHLIVGDPATATVEWQSSPAEQQLAYPTDADGDGRPELLVWTDRLAMVDLDDPRAVWSQEVPVSRWGLGVGQVDGDPGLEVVAYGYAFHGPRVVALDRSTGELEWQSEPLPEGSGRVKGTMRLAPLDGDAVDEIAVSSDCRAYVFDGASRVIQWTSGCLDGEITDLDIGDVDDDPALELAMLTATGVVLVDTSTWAEEGRFPVVAGHRLLLVDDRVIVGSSDHNQGDVRCFTPSGELLWRRWHSTEGVDALAALSWNHEKLIAVGGPGLLTILRLDGSRVLASRDIQSGGAGVLFTVDLDGDGHDELGVADYWLVEVNQLRDASTATLGVGSAAAAPGTSAVLGVSLSGSAFVSSMVFDLTFGSQLSAVDVSPGDAATAAGKTLSSGPIAGGVRVSVVGTDASPIQDGVVALLELAVAPTTYPRVLEVEATSRSALDTAGRGVTLGTTAGSFTVLPEGGVPTGCGDPQWFVAASANLPGDTGSEWRTDLTILNPLPVPQPVRLWFYPRGADNSDVVCVDAGVAPASSALLFEDVVLSVFGLDGAGGIGVANPLGIDDALRVVSRTYNQTDDGTFGQSIPGLDHWSAVVALQTKTLTQLHENGSYRTNLGFLEISGTGATVSTQLFTADGVLHLERVDHLRPFEALQLNRVFGAGAGVTNGFAQVRVTSWEGRVLAYASVVDNSTGDPTYVRPQ